MIRYIVTRVLTMIAPVISFIVACVSDAEAQTVTFGYSYFEPSDNGVAKLRLRANVSDLVPQSDKITFCFQIFDAEANDVRFKGSDKQAYWITQQYISTKDYLNFDKTFEFKTDNILWGGEESDYFVTLLVYNHARNQWVKTDDTMMAFRFNPARGTVRNVPGVITEASAKLTTDKNGDDVLYNVFGYYVSAAPNDELVLEHSLYDETHKPLLNSFGKPYTVSKPLKCNSGTAGRYNPQDVVITNLSLINLPAGQHSIAGKCRVFNKTTGKTLLDGPMTDFKLNRKGGYRLENYRCETLGTGEDKHTRISVDLSLVGLVNHDIRANVNYYDGEGMPLFTLSGLTHGAEGNMMMQSNADRWTFSHDLYHDNISGAGGETRVNCEVELFDETTNTSLGALSGKKAEFAFYVTLPDRKEAYNRLMQQAEEHIKSEIRRKREQAAREQAAREQAAREQAAREQASREQAAREQAAREQASREQSNSYSGSGLTVTYTPGGSDGLLINNTFIGGMGSGLLIDNTYVSGGYEGFLSDNTYLVRPDGSRITSDSPEVTGGIYLQQHTGGGTSGGHRQQYTSRDCRQCGGSGVCRTCGGTRKATSNMYGTRSVSSCRDCRGTGRCPAAVHSR